MEVLDLIHSEVKDLRSELREMRKDIVGLKIKIYGITTLSAAAVSLLIHYLKGIM